MSIPQNAVALGLRIAELRAHLGLNQREFAELTGISTGYVSQIEQGKTRASLDLVLNLAERLPHLSRDWLLMGEGAMLSGGQQSSRQRHSTTVAPPAHESVVDTGNAGTTYDSIVRNAALRLLREGQLGELALLAQTGYQEPAWRVLGELVRLWPRRASAQELHTLVAATGPDLTATISTIISLERLGLIDASQQGYTLRVPDPNLKATTPGDVAQQVREAIWLLSRDISEAVEEQPPCGYILTTRCTLPAGTARELAHDVRKRLEEATQAAEDAAEVESAVVVLGVLAKHT